MMKKRFLILLLPVVMSAWLTAAPGPAATVSARTISLPPEGRDLEPGSGLREVQLNCVLCHSLEYIKMQPRLTNAQWGAVVTKMIRIYGARINADDVRAITDYLAEYYGTGKQ